MFYDLFCSFVLATIIVAIIGGIVYVCCKYRIVAASLIVIVILFMGFIFLPDALAEEEVRTAYLTNFNLSEGSFVLEDEDGYLWEFGFLEDEYHLGDEYILHLPENTDPWYEKPQDDTTFCVASGVSISVIGLVLYTFLKLWNAS